MDPEVLLENNLRSPLLRLSTAGSVDDGKSTLIGRLLHDTKSIYQDQIDAAKKESASKSNEDLSLSYLLDGLKSEREQGITIDVAYRYFSTPKRRFIIADTPGHEQYTRNMVTGASNADLAIILIDARKGISVQSKRHGFIASLLGIPHFVIAINKMDLVDYSEDVFRRICDEYGVFATKLEVKDIKFIPVSALKGDNIVDPSRNMPWYDGEPLLKHMESVYIGGNRNLIDFRFPVQLVLRPNQDFRGFAGTVASGVVRVGDEVMALPSRKISRVKRIVTHAGDLEYAFAPLSITLVLEDEIDVGRGDMLAHPSNQPSLKYEVETILVWMREEPMELNSPYIIKHTTKTVRGAFSRLAYKIDPNELHRKNDNRMVLNEIGRATLELFQPLACDPYARNRSTGNFIVIDPRSNDTVGAGVIIDRVKSQERVDLASDIKPVSRNIVSHFGIVTKEERESILDQKGATVWLTGLSFSGKSTIAYTLEKLLMGQKRPCYVLDGENIRQGLNRDLDFSPGGRRENIRRIAEVARLFNDAGIIVITAFISPYQDDRKGAREIVGEEKFIEVFVDAPLETCVQRDTRGLYDAARKNEIPKFTGISAPYEAPMAPHIHLRTDEQSIEECVRTIHRYLTLNEFIQRK